MEVAPIIPKAAQFSPNNLKVIHSNQPHFISIAKSCQVRTVTYPSWETFVHCPSKLIDNLENELSWHSIAPYSIPSNKIIICTAMFHWLRFDMFKCLCAFFFVNRMDCLVCYRSTITAAAEKKTPPRIKNKTKLNQMKETRVQCLYDCDVCLMHVSKILHAPTINWNKK